MSRPISLFSGYSQRENRTTNYCLLLLKMLYEENPKFLAEVMSAVVGEDLGERIGVKFRQQEPKASSTPDGLILQRAFTIYIETKNWDWFYSEQLAKHLAALNEESPGLKVLIALANFESAELEKFAPVRQLCAQQYKGEIIFKEVSFEDFVQALQLPSLPKNLMDAVAEFRSYLDEQNLLPSWERLLDVVNCAGTADNEVLVGNVYMCPTTGGAYNHQRCKYFGMYRDKHIEQVALIEAVVDVEAPEKATVKWHNVSRSKDELKTLAEEKVQKLRPGAFPTRVFLLGPLYATNCQKDSPRGMQTSKQYFDVGPLKVDGAEQLAHALSDKTWSEIRALSTL